MPEPEVVERNAVIETEKGTIKFVLYDHNHNEVLTWKNRAH